MLNNQVLKIKENSVKVCVAYWSINIESYEWFSLHDMLFFRIVVLKQLSIEHVITILSEKVVAYSYTFFAGGASGALWLRPWVEA